MLSSSILNTSQMLLAGTSVNHFNLLNQVYSTLDESISQNETHQLSKSLAPFSDGLETIKCSGVFSPQITSAISRLHHITQSRENLDPNEAIDISRQIRSIILFFNEREPLSSPLQVESALHLCMEETAHVTGKEFLNTLVKHLAVCFGVKFAFASELNPENKEEVHTLAFWADGKFTKPFSYPLADTPCEQVIDVGQAYFPNDVEEKFPKDKWLKDNGIESYLAVAFSNADGTAMGHLGIMHDRALIINENQSSALKILASRVGAELQRLKVETALKASEARFREMAENLDEVFFMTDRFGSKLFYVNPAFESIWGLSTKSLYDDPIIWLKSVHPNDKTHITDCFESMQRTGNFDEEFQIIRPDGSTRWIHYRVYQIKNGSAHHWHLVGVATDITERKDLESKLRQAQKMEALGTLMAGIAHDFNNLLQAGINSLELTSEALKNIQTAHDLESAKQSLQEAENIADKARTLIGEMMTFARKEKYTFAIADLSPLIQEISGELKNEVLRSEKNVAIVLQMSGNCTAFIDETSIRAALKNIAENALQSIDHDGSVKLTLESVFLNETACQSKVGLWPGSHIRIRIVDDGTGIAPEHRERIFEPFFTTKEIGEGTGLGLTTTYATIQAHKGLIEVESQVALGTTFTIYLPAVSEKPKPQQPYTETDEYRARKVQSILFVDDTSLIRRSAVRLIKHMGFEVWEASNGLEALALFKEKKPDLTIMDYQMPGMNGLQTIEQIRALDPDAKIILSTGHPDRDELPFLKNEHSLLLGKPYRRAALIQSLFKLGLMEKITSTET